MLKDIALGKVPGPDRRRCVISYACDGHSYDRTSGVPVRPWSQMQALPFSFEGNVREKGLSRHLGQQPAKPVPTQRLLNVDIHMTRGETSV